MINDRMIESGWGVRNGGGYGDAGVVNVVNIGAVGRRLQALPGI